jgi:aspartate ammonia-lyase
VRAVENFPITGVAISAWPALICGLAAVKEAAALANSSLGLVGAETAQAIVAACREIRGGHLRDQFVVDVIQGGAGTSTNMNANEVIANRALEIHGHSKGDYERLHPNDEVNCSQSTNDVYPTALRLALIHGTQHLQTGLEQLRLAFAAKAYEFSDLPKIGRTQLQDAVPMTVGQEFGAYATVISSDQARLAAACEQLRFINLGATAIGTGVAAPPSYAKAALGHLVEITGLPLQTAPDLVAATHDCGPLVALSGALRGVAVSLSKICNDLRLLSSGPRAGIGELNLPARQAGSSIMPAKINPVIPEVVNQIAFEAIGHDVTVTLAAEAGQLQLNAFQPIIAHSLSTMINHLDSGCRLLARLCVQDITVNEARLRKNVAESVGIATALNPILGYAIASSVAQEALSTGRSVADVVRSRGLLTETQLLEALSAGTPDHVSRD